VSGEAAVVESRPGGEAILRVEELVVQFDVGASRPLTALDSVSIEIHDGETLGLVGESGCGKSTLGRAILQLIRPASGRVWLLGQELTELSGSALRAMRKQMQIVFQDPRGSLDPRMKIRQIVEEPLKVHRLGNGRERRRLAREMLAEVGIDPSLEQRYPSQLSGGMQQRVGIARALVTGPRLVICDEPVSSLDVSIQAQVLNLLQRLKERFGVAYLFIAHNLAVVRYLSDRVAVMYLGQIVETAPTERLFAEPRHPYTRALIASVLRPDREAPAHLARAERLVAGEVPGLLRPPDGCRYHTRCIYARERCREQVPALESTEGRPPFDHRVACHFWREIIAAEDEAAARSAPA
jgi:oligopeptide/dipeptide ABC transporter ATP-binding protein